MPRCYFGVREGPSSTPDEEGFEFDSLDEAECGAATSAAEIGQARLPKGDARQVTVGCCHINLEMRSSGVDGPA